jgi:cytochrome c-type biogenesis protein CcmH
LLDRALALHPDSQRGLWLLGIAAYQEQDFATAASTWERLLAQIPPDAEPRAALLERIAEARSNAGLAPLVAESDASAAGSEPGKPGSTGEGTADGPRLTVRVDIAPDLKAKVGASDVLFVFARAAQGPRMPLAIQRLAAASLPVTVTLDDSTSMMPALKLSTVPQVVVGRAHLEVGVRPRRRAAISKCCRFQSPTPMPTSCNSPSTRLCRDRIHSSRHPLVRAALAVPDQARGCLAGCTHRL